MRQRGPPTPPAARATREHEARARPGPGHAELAGATHRGRAPESVFRAWTEVEPLKRWWGPAGITCTDAEVDAHGDFLAMMGTCKRASARLDEVVDRYGGPVVLECIEAILARSERVVQKAIKELPRGQYFYEDYLESDGYTTDPVRAECVLTVTGRELIFDFTGTAA